MHNIKTRNRLFLWLCMFSYLLLGCGSDDSSSSSTNTVNTTNTKHIPISKPKQDTDPKPEPIPTSTLVITASQTNAMMQPFSQFNLGLVNIKFTVIPEGKDKEIDVYLYPESDSTSGTDQSNDIDLTSLQDNQHILVDTLSIPTGTITSMTISFSGANSHIALKGNPSMKLVDCFFSGFSTPDEGITRIRKTPVKLLIKTHIELTEDKFEYINMTIDKSMTAGGIDPYFLINSKSKEKQQYIQFVPTLTVNTLAKDQNIPLVIINDKAINTNKTTNRLIQDAVAPMTISTTSGLNPATKQRNDDQVYALFISSLSTNDIPSLALDTIEWYPTKEERRIAMATLNSQYQQSLQRPDKVFLHYRDTFKEHLQASNFGDIRFNVLTPSKTEKDKVVFQLPDQTYLVKVEVIKHQGFYGQWIEKKQVRFNEMPWTNKNILTFTQKNPNRLLEQVEFLNLPLGDAATGNFIIVESGRIDIGFGTFSILPDLIHQFDSSDDFYKLLKRKLEHENALIGGLEIDGTFTPADFTATNGMKVILLTQDYKSQVKTIIMALGIVLFSGLSGLIDHIEQAPHTQNP